jgi:hypothetical protein
MRMRSRKLDVLPAAALPPIPAPSAAAPAQPKRQRRLTPLHLSSSHSLPSSSFFSSSFFSSSSCAPLKPLAGQGTTYYDPTSLSIQPLRASDRMSLAANMSSTRTRSTGVPVAEMHELFKTTKRGLQANARRRDQQLSDLIKRLRITGKQSRTLIEEATAATVKDVENLRRDNQNVNTTTISYMQKFHDRTLSRQMQNGADLAQDAHHQRELARIELARIELARIELARIKVERVKKRPAPKNPRRVLLAPIVSDPRAQAAAESLVRMFDTSLRVATALPASDVGARASLVVKSMADSTISTSH